MENLKMTEVDFLNDYLLTVSLSNGHKIVYDMKPVVRTARFQTLLDAEEFKKGELVEERLIRWSGQVELSLEEILLNLSNEIKHSTEKKP